MTLIIFLLLIVTLAAVFSVQNAAPVAIVFLFWSFEASLAIVFFISVLGGAAAASVVYYLVRLKRRLKSRY
ncbi:MAG: hypothetical protein DDT21_00758 [Syntrophomonadaceae bacterium]|nr:hypothetical protein [Bacillota bacterium]